MTKSDLTSKVLMTANITWVSMKIGYWWKVMLENFSFITALCESRKLEEKNTELCGRLLTKISPGRCAGNKSIFFLALRN